MTANLQKVVNPNNLRELGIDVGNTAYENSQQDLLENSKNLSWKHLEELPQNIDSVICSTPSKTLKADKLAKSDDIGTPVKGPRRYSQRTRRLPKYLENFHLY